MLHAARELPRIPLADSRYLDTVETQGGRILTGGFGDGWVVRPTVITDMPQGAPHWCEEIFGPLVVVAPSDTEADALRGPPPGHSVPFCGGGTRERGAHEPR
ncbi:aldehyde dehydrogenase family protein [Actinomadura sp. SCN-SB]|uniref:aldehyde dehydrogenase family protein n=1 Tax=Actinomadura sp. SCN-SB TaxID=3373092 RepID=UPI003751696B